VSVFEKLVNALKSVFATYAKIDVIITRLEYVENELAELKNDVNHLSERIDHIYDLLFNFIKNNRK